MNVEPVRQARLLRARAEAERVLTQARSQADAVVNDARSQADAMVQRARDEGRREADGENEDANAASAHEARELVLRAQRDAVASLRAAASAAVLDLRDDSAYPALLQRLREAGLEQLGPQATVEVDQDGGGVVVRSGPRRVDYTLAAVADRWLEQLGPRLEDLWR